MEPIKIVGQWRRGGHLKPGLYLYRKPGSVHLIGVATLKIECDPLGSDIYEYLGPIEIVEPKPEPTPLPGCVCHVTQMRAGKWRSASAHQPDSNELVVYGDTRRQAILRHNAAVAAIVAMESK